MASWAVGVGYGTLTSLIPAGSVRFALPTRAPKTMRSYGDSAQWLEAFVRDGFGVTSVVQHHP